MRSSACYRSLKPYKYQLTQAFEFETKIMGFQIQLKFIQLGTNGMLRVGKNYAWDGASGPTLDTKNSMRASLVHDVLYQLLRLGELPQEYVLIADQLFREILLTDGMHRFRAWYWFEGLRLAKGKAARAGTQKEPVEVCVPKLEN